MTVGGLDPGVRITGVERSHLSRYSTVGTSEEIFRLAWFGPNKTRVLFLPLQSDVADGNVSVSSSRSGRGSTMR